MAKSKQDKTSKTGALEDEVKHLKRRLEEQRAEIDELRDLNRRLTEHLEDSDRVIESWCETFSMKMTDGGWTWEPFWQEHNQLVDDYNDLVRRWNKYLPLITNKSRPVGRPLAASEAQVSQVQDLRLVGRSLRGSAEDTSLSLDTVRTIVGKMDGSDRNTRKHARRLGLDPIKIERERVATWKRQKRTGDALPRRVNALLKTSADLRKEARGVKATSRKHISGLRWPDARHPKLGARLIAAEPSLRESADVPVWVSGPGLRLLPRSCPSACR